MRFDANCKVTWKPLRSTFSISLLVTAASSELPFEKWNGNVQLIRSLNASISNSNIHNNYLSSNSSGAKIPKRSINSSNVRRVGNPAQLILIASNTPCMPHKVHHLAFTGMTKEFQFCNLLPLCLGQNTKRLDCYWQLDTMPIVLWCHALVLPCHYATT